MEANAGLVAGSHNRNELVVIRRDGDLAGRQSQQLSGQTCQICGDDVGLNADGELFVACNECAFPLCKTCYEYERSEGSQVCPQCKTRFKRLKVQPRPMDPSKDLAAYGYGSVAWKERMETWKQKQDKLQLMKSENGRKDWDDDDPDLPLVVSFFELSFDLIWNGLCNRDTCCCRF